MYPCKHRRLYAVVISNSYGFLPEAVWLTTLRVNATSRLVEIPRLVSCANAMSCVVEMPCLVEMSCLMSRLVTWKQYSPCKIMRGAMQNHACRNEVIIEQTVYVGS